jgi:hypothetical protein
MDDILGIRHSAKRDTAIQLTRKGEVIVHGPTNLQEGVLANQ